MLDGALARLRADGELEADFHALCDLGGRFAGTASEARAREWLASRLAEATGEPVRRETVAYRGWARGPSSVVDAVGTEWSAQALGRSPAAALTAPPCAPPSCWCGMNSCSAPGTCTGAGSTTRRGRPAPPVS